jgi:stage II sporulation protein D
MLIGSVALSVGVVTLAGLAVSSFPDGIVDEPATPPSTELLVRVLLARDKAAVKIAIDGPFDVTDGRGTQRHSFTDALPASAVRADSAPWYGPRLHVGGRIAGGSVLELTPARDGTLRVSAGDGPMRRYRGSLRLMLRDDGGVDVINLVDVESYLKGVLRGELPGSFHREAFRAQAIAARSYALYHRETAGRQRSWDVTATQSSQVYVGMEGERRGSKAVAAVESTRGVVCTWDGGSGPSLVCAFYSAVCGGCTRDVRHMAFLDGVPPLSGGVECAYCQRAPKGFYRWGPVTVAKSRIAAALKSRYDEFRDFDRVAHVEVDESDDRGRPIVLRVIDASGRSARIRSENFRLAIDSSGMEIKSADFELIDQSGSVVLRNGRGWGHGAGLCQWGSDGMARTGKRAEEILATYYPHSQLRKIDG